MDVETRLFYVLAAGYGLAAVGLLWLIVAAFRVRWSWGLSVLVFLPVALPIFVIRHRRPSGWPMLTLLAGLAIGSTPIAYNKMAAVDLGPHEKLVGDELHLTLTGWDRRDYSVLASRPSAVVVQMANPDVTDRTLAYLRDLTRLRELDLNNTQVGDEGLAELEPLVGLELLRLKGTKITDPGFLRWLAPRPALRQLDLRGTAVTEEVALAWKKAKPGRRLLR